MRTGHALGMPIALKMRPIKAIPWLKLPAVIIRDRSESIDPLLIAALDQTLSFHITRIDSMDIGQPASTFQRLVNGR